MAIAHIPLALVSMDGDTFWIFVGRRDNDYLQHQPRAANAAGWHICRPYWIGITRAGVVTANDTFWRSLTALSATLWLVMNLPFPQLISLLKRAHIPCLLTEQILLTWRFLFILLDEAVAIRRAQTLRFGYCSLSNGYRSLAMLTGLLFTRVLMRYQQMTTTLDIKLYQGDFHL